MLACGVLVQGWLGVCGCCFGSLCFLSLLNVFYFLFVWPLSAECPFVVCCYSHDLSGVVATQFFACAVFIVWPSSALTSCFAAISDCHFSVQDLGLYMTVYSFGEFATPSMLAFWTCGAIGRWLDHCIFFSMGCSVFSVCRQISLHVFRVFRFSFVLWQSLGRFVPIYFLRCIIHLLSARGLELCFYCTLY